MKTRKNKKLQLFFARQLSLSTIVFISSFLLLFGCKKLLDVPKSSSLVLNKDVFANNETATSAVLGLYNKMVTLNLSISNGGLSIYPALSADELASAGNQTSYDTFLFNAILPTDGIINNNFWSASYKNIYHANAILEGLNGSGALTSSVKNQLRGETLVIRSLYFFYLTNLFGDVPLVLSTDFEQNAVMPRTPANVIVEQLIADLKEAVELLAPTYVSTARARVNSFTARAFLARLYLYNKQWENAESESGVVISSSLYNLESDLDKTFVNTSKETIWQLVRENLNTAEAVVLIPVSAMAIPNLVIRDELLNSFEPGDQRKKHWITFNSVNSQRYYYPYKYKIRTGSVIGEHLVVFRLAEQYLIRAEARAEQGNLSGALDDLNVLRSRARALVTPEMPDPLPDIPSGLSNSVVLNSIYKERSHELFCEWGHRWLDLKRTNMAGAVLSKLKPTWNTYAELYPIPFSETQLNPYLTQNPGYAN